MGIIRGAKIAYSLTHISTLNCEFLLLFLKMAKFYIIIFDHLMCMVIFKYNGEN